MAITTAKKYLNKTGLKYFYQKIREVFVSQEEGKGLSTNDFTDAWKDKLEAIDPDSYLTGVTSHDHSVEVTNGSEIAVKISEAEDNILTVRDDEGNEGLYLAKEHPFKIHKLTFGLGQEYTFDGTADITVPVYTGTINE